MPKGYLCPIQKKTQHSIKLMKNTIEIGAVVWVVLSIWEIVADHTIGLLSQISIIFRF